MSYINEFMGQLFGGLVFTGTPKEVGIGFMPSKFSHASDDIVAEVGGLGAQEHKAIDCSS